MHDGARWDFILDFFFFFNLNVMNEWVLKQVAESGCYLIGRDNVLHCPILKRC